MLIRLQEKVHFFRAIYLLGRQGGNQGHRCSQSTEDGIYLHDFLFFFDFGFSALADFFSLGSSSSSKCW